GPVAESGGADPQLDGAAGAVDARGAAASHGRVLRRSEGLVSAPPGRTPWSRAFAVGLAVAFAAGRVGPVAAQDDRPQLEASVDEDRVSVGEELTYTLRAVSHSPVPMQVTLAPFIGLEV